MADISKYNGKHKYLILVGASGTGKSTIKNLLIQCMPEIFTNVVQYTTRPMREGEAPDSYRFVDAAQFETVKDSLIGCCTINGNTYGSIPMQNDDRVGIIILNQEGLDNFLSFEQSNPQPDYFIIVGVERPLEEALKVRGAERGEAFIKAEYEIYKHAQYIYHNDFETIALAETTQMFYKLANLMQLRDYQACLAAEAFTRTLK